MTRIARQLFVLIVAISALTGATVVRAGWSGNTAPGGSAGAAAATLAAGLQPQATTASPTAGAVDVAWAATGGAVPPDAYQVRAFDAATGTPRPTVGPCAALVPGPTCRDEPAPEGRWTYSVTPRRGQWLGAESPRSAPVTVDLNAPTAQISFPATGTRYSNTGWNTGCANAICGSAADTIGLASVAVSIRQGTGNYWNGTVFASSTEVLLPATGTTAWSYGFGAAGFPADGTYTVRAVATDTVGRSASRSTTFTIDRTAPRPIALTLGNADGFFGVGDTVAIQYSEALRPSSICSAWTGTGNQQLTNASVVMVADLTRTTPTISSPSCALNIGASRASALYVTTTSTFQPSTLTWDASTNTLRITAGPRTSGIVGILGVLPHTANYTPAAAITDLAGNPIVTTTFNASGQRF